MAKTEKRFFGDVGEGVASRFLVKQDFDIVERNYLRKWGEIDIVAKKRGILHFVEVKTQRADISRETHGYNPAENVHPQKLKRLYRAVETYLAEKHVSREMDWQIDVVTVLLDLESKKAKVDLIENVV